MRGPEDEEPSTFTDGIAEWYEDGLLRKEHSAGAPRMQDRDGRNVPPPGLSGDALRRFRELVQQERRVSEQRRRFHDRIAFLESLGDAAAGEPTTRATLEYLLGKERQISRQRKELHRLIDEIG